MGNLRDELQTIYDQRGTLTPAITVNAARENPAAYPTVHGDLEWDDSVAGEKYRLVQAGQMIRSVSIAYVGRTGEKQETRAFVSVRRPTGNEYVPTEKARDDPMTKAIVLAEYQRALNDLRRRYGHLEEFFDLARQVLAA